MTRVGILISGSGTNMQTLVDSMTGEHPARACVVLSNVPGAGGLAKAAARGVPTETVDHRPFGRDRAAFESALDAALAPHAPDILCLAGFMRVLTEDFVARWAGRMLNIHPSLLPKYRGLDTHARALAAGEAEHGCTVHAVTPALDDGPILGQARLRVAPDDTPQTLSARVQALEHRLYPLVLRRFADGITDPVTLD
ncbi:phosphoribosylglycinamide formyltransferase [Citreimonas sp.]|uniref:phosphoribosylglycinamide formyltransferase n=1 Tax=Citreimonas sp. TaxID=3036715 RepID=UPI0035C7E695